MEDIKKHYLTIIAIIVGVFALIAVLIVYVDSKGACSPCESLKSRFDNNDDEDNSDNKDAKSNGRTAVDDEINPDDDGDSVQIGKPSWYESADLVVNEGDMQVALKYLGESTWEYYFLGWLPTPCHSYDFSNVIQESYPESVIFQFELINQNSDEMCIQVLEDVEENGLINVSKDAKFELVVK